MWTASECYVACMLWIPPIRTSATPADTLAASGASRSIFQILYFLFNCDCKFIRKLNFAFSCILQESDENVRAELEQTVWIPLLLCQGGSSPGNVRACVRAWKYACIVNVSEETITDNVRVCNQWVQCACVRGNHRQLRYACSWCE